MKYYIVVGEASGDLHASNLIKAIKNKDSQSEFRFLGGDLMQKVSEKEPVIHYKKMSFMGFFEVLKNIITIFKYLKICKNDIKLYNPDILILVDYPGFNFSIMKYAKKVLNLKNVYYYISPQLWAWKSSRIKSIKKYVDKLFVILPFEEQWYKERDFNKVYYVGHPLMEVFEKREKTNKNKFIHENKLENKPIISLLPGSRFQEIMKILPIMLSLTEKFSDFQFVIAKAKSIDLSVYKNILNQKKIKIIDDKTYDLLSISDAAIVTSGTATLETALLGIPQIVCYKGSKISYEISKILIKHIKYISLVNLIMKKEIVTELIQNNLNKDKLYIELNKILYSDKRSQIIDSYKELHEKLKSGASEKIAEIICQDI